MRLFIASEIDAEIRNKINPVQSILNKKGIKLVEKDNIHITLKFLGEVEGTIVEKTIGSLESIIHPSFKMQVKGIGFFPNLDRIRVVWAGVDEGGEQMSELAGKIENNLKKIGFKKEKKKYTAHATIARVKNVSPLEKKEILSQIEPFRDMEFGTMIVKNFKLKKSVLTPKGPIYSDLKVFHLDG